MGTEADLMQWLREHKPGLACTLDYCATDDEVRKVLNAHSGLSIQPDEDKEEAFGKYLESMSGRRAML